MHSRPVSPGGTGRFYLDELPALRAVPDGPAGMSMLIAGGYAGLDLGGRPGLGARAHGESASR